MNARGDPRKSVRRIDQAKMKVLNSPIRQGMRRTIEVGLHTARAEGVKAGQNLVQIGRMLGL